MPARGRSAHKRHDRSFLDAIEFARGAGPRIVGERGLQAIREIPLSDARYFAVVSADRLRRGVDAHPAMQVLER